jgi:hypothetical protein
MAASRSTRVYQEMGDSVEQKEYIIRTQSDVANTYGLGEVVVPGVALFTYGNYDLTKDQLNKKLKQLGKVILR